MKKTILFLTVIGILFSCNKNDDANMETDLFGVWKLDQMTGNILNSETTGSEMEWQEFYLLNADGTFKKTRDRNGTTTEVFGTYNLINSSSEKLLELNYNSESEIIGSCYPDLKEEMFFQSENSFSSTWKNCDGPGLKYKKAN